MTDPRWQRAMERLGLLKPATRSWGNQHGTYTDAVAMDPNDPATFLRVVEALRQRDITIHIDGQNVMILLEPPIGQVWAPTLYEAVMEAFGGE